MTAKPPDGRNSAAMEARRTKMRDGQIIEVGGPPADQRRRGVVGKESPHAAACRALDAAKHANDGSDPLPSLADAGPPTCTGCHRRKLPIGWHAATVAEPLDERYCQDGCYAYRWSPTPPTTAAFVPYPDEAGKP